MGKYPQVLPIVDRERHYKFVHAWSVQLVAIYTIAPGGTVVVFSLKFATKGSGSEVV